VTAVTFRVHPAFGDVIDALAQMRGLRRSEYLRQLVTEDAIRLAVEIGERVDTDDT